MQGRRSFTPAARTGQKGKHFVDGLDDARETTCPLNGEKVRRPVAKDECLDANDSSHMITIQKFALSPGGERPDIHNRACITCSTRYMGRPRCTHWHLDSSRSGESIRSDSAGARPLGRGVVWPEHARSSSVPCCGASDLRSSVILYAGAQVGYPMRCEEDGPHGGGLVHFLAGLHRPSQGPDLARWPMPVTCHAYRLFSTLALGITWACMQRSGSFSI